MRVYVVGTRGIPNIQGGIETHCMELYPRLVARGVDVTVICRAPYAKQGLKEYKGVRLVSLPCPRSRGIEAVAHTFLATAYCILRRPDIVHFHAIGPALFVPLVRIFGIRTVVTHHGSDYERSKWGWFAKLILKTGERMAARFSNQIIVISRLIGKSMRSRYHRTDCILIPNGVNRPEQTSQTDYIEQLRLTPRKYILGIGRLVPEKGFHDLIHAYTRLADSSWKLVIAGRADHEDGYSLSIKTNAQKHGVILPGFVTGESLYQLYSHAGLFAIPSYHEGLPIALLEALSYGLRVVASDIPSLKEIELPLENYFQLGNVTDLAQRLQFHMSDPTTPDYATYLKHFDWEKIADQTYDVYKSMFKGKTRN